ncbi:MAG: TetR/AcrR family transcriptional regulator [Cyanobacteria bacterium P01_F01_bin.143]
MKSKILDIAIQQMKKGGYDNLNFAHIASDLSTTRANLHHHFKNKEGLALAATETYLESQMQIVGAILLKHHGDILSIATELEEYLIKTIKDNGSYNSCICTQLIRDYGLPESLKLIATDHFKKMENTFENQIEISQKNGNLKSKEDPKRLAFKLMNNILGIYQYALIEENQEELFKYTKGSLKSILE